MLDFSRRRALTEGGGTCATRLKHGESGGGEEEGREGRDTRAASPLLSTHLWGGLAVAPSHGVQFFRHVQFFKKDDSYRA